MTLKEVMAQLIESRDALLKALEKHTGEDGQLIADIFLAEFLDPEPDRSKLARKFAAETTLLIKDFAAETSRMAEAAAIVSVKMNTVVSGITIDVLNEGMTRVGTPNAAGGFEKVAREAEEMAIEAGNQTIRIQNLIANVLDVRTHTLQGFRKENLQLSLSEIVKRMRAEIDADAKKKLSHEAWEAAKAASEELRQLIEDEAPIWRLTKIVRKFGKIVGPKEVDTSPGGTDAMLKLLEQLRKENQALRSLDSAYEEALARLEDLAA